MMLSTASTSSAGTARLPVTGCTPLFANVAAMNARSRQVTLTEHCLK